VSETDVSALIYMQIHARIDCRMNKYSNTARGNSQEQHKECVYLQIKHELEVSNPFNNIQTECTASKKRHLMAFDSSNFELDLRTHLCFENWLQKYLVHNYIIFCTLTTLPHYILSF